MHQNWTPQTPSEKRVIVNRALCKRRWLWMTYGNETTFKRSIHSHHRVYVYCVACSNGLRSIHWTLANRVAFPSKSSAATNAPSKIFRLKLRLACYTHSRECELCRVVLRRRELRSKTACSPVSVHNGCRCITGCQLPQWAMHTGQATSDKQSDDSKTTTAKRKCVSLFEESTSAHI